MSEDKTVAVCCDTPLIQTFIFRGAEFYCRECGANIPIMNANSISSTPELERQKEENKKWFLDIAKDIIPDGAYKKSCHKCETRQEYHIQHATEEEKNRSIEAYKKLKNQ